MGSVRIEVDWGRGRKDKRTPIDIELSIRKPERVASKHSVRHIIGDAVVVLCVAGGVQEGQAATTKGENLPIRSGVNALDRYR